MKIAIVSFCTSNILNYASLTASINKRYCQHHAYRFIHEVYDQTELHPSHEKVKVVRRHLPEADYVMWIDSDACVIDFRQRIEDFCSSNHDLIIAGHEFGFDLLGYRTRYEINGLPAGLNGGVWILRNSPWSYEFLEAWWERCVRGHRIPTSFLEQGQLQHMLSRNTLGIVERTKLVVPCSRLNRCDDQGKDVCDFILHAWGTSAKQRIDLFGPIAKGQRPKTGVDMPSFYVLPVDDATRSSYPLNRSGWNPTLSG